MGLPEEVSSLKSDQSVVVVVLLGKVEWRVTSINDEKDDPEGKQIHSVGLVLLLKVDLWGHVAKSTYTCGVGTASVTASNVTGESKIDNLDIEFLVEHDVLWLQITMGITM